jgi:cysteine-rich repeat protein
MKYQLSFVALGLLFACAEEPALPGCPGTHSLDAFGVCRARCTADPECFASEECLDQLCVPRQDQGPIVTLFRVDTPSIEPGGTVVIDYAVSFADEVLITAEDAVGTATVLGSPILAGSTFYGPITRDVRLKILATRGGATDMAELTVGVQGDLPVAIASFTASPTRIVVGESAELDWQILRGDGTLQIIQGAQVLSEDPQARPFSVQPLATTEYTLVANGLGGPVQATVMVVVDAQPQPLQILSFDAIRPNEPRPGDNAVLVWATSGAERLLLEELGGAQGDRALLDLRDPIRAEGGQWVVLPEPGLSYRLTIEANGDTKRQVLGLPSPPMPEFPVISRFEVGPGVIEQSGFPRVEWEVTPELATVVLYANGVAVWQGSGSSSYTDQSPVTETTRFDLEVSAAGAVQRARRTTFLAIEEQSEANEQQSEAQAVTPGYLRGNFREINGQANDEDWYSFVPADGDAAQAALDCTAGGLNRMLILDLYDPSGNLLHTDVGPCPVVTATHLSRAVHFLRVTALGLLSQLDTYEVFLETNPGLCGNGEVELGEACDDANGLPNDSCTPWCRDDLTQEMEARDLGELAFNPAGNAEVIPIYSRPGESAPRDRGAAVVLLPFDFPYRGARHRGIFVHTDGYLSFLPGASSAPVGGTAPNSVLAPFAADLRVPLGQNLSAYESEWEGSRAVVIDFARLQFADEPLTELSARVGLLADGRVYFRYGTLDAPGRSVQAAIDDASGGGVVQVPGCTERSNLCDVMVVPQAHLIEFGPSSSTGGN